MAEEEILKEWFVRYTRIFNKRYSKKQKSLFLDAVVADIKAMRQDVKLHTYTQEKGPKGSGRNVYVGKIKQAKTIICTYYDTPLIYSGEYHLFDKELQKKQTVMVQILLSVFYLLIGIVLATVFSFFKTPTAVSVISYGIYLLGLLVITKGIPESHTEVRNTSSVLLILQSILLLKKQNVAFALLDNGCGNNDGLEKLLALKKEDAKVYYLDSIGADEALYLIKESGLRYLGNNQEMVELKGQFLKRPDLLSIVSAQQTHGDSRDDLGLDLVLSKEALNKRQLKAENLNTVYDYLEAVVSGTPTND